MTSRTAGPAAVAAALLLSVGTALASLAGLLGPIRATVSEPHLAPPVAAAPTIVLPTRPGRVETLVAASPDAPGGHRMIWVYRPAVPDTSTLPVLYFLHGLPGGALDLAQVHLARTLDQAFTSGQLSPFVVAAPDGNSLGASDPEWADSVKGHVKLESFVTGPLITAVEGPHLRDARHRAIAGFSMGGYGAVNLALKHPDLYGQVASFAGYFHIDDPSHVFGQRPAVEAANSPDRHAADFGAVRVFLADGAQDTEPLLRGETARFAQLLSSAGHPALVSLPQGGGHSWDFVRAELPALEDFLEQGWAPRPAWDHPELAGPSPVP